MKKILIEDNISKLIIISILSITLIASNVNSMTMNFFNNISLIVDIGLCKTTIPLLFIYLLIFATLCYLWDKKFLNKNLITTLLILYIIYHLCETILAFLNGREFVQSTIVFSFYPVFALYFLRKNINFDILYLLNKIKLFVYLALAFSISLLIFNIHVTYNFADLFYISLLLISFEVFEKNNIKTLILIIILTLITGTRLTFLGVTFFFIIIIFIYFFKKQKLQKLILITIIIIIASGFFIPSFYSKLLDIPYLSLPPQERFTKTSLLYATGRKPLWGKYILTRDPSLFELLFGGGIATRFSISNLHNPGISNFVTHLHNIFFDEFYKTGIIGLFLLFLIIIISLRSRSPTYLKIFFILLLISGLFEQITYKGIIGILFWMTVGILNNVPKTTIIQKSN